MAVMGAAMPSSGTGNSYDALYRTCQRKFYYAERLAISSTRSAPPLLVGEAIHKYAETLLNAWLAGSRDKQVVMAESMGEYDTILGQYDPENVDLTERDQLARAVLPLWAERQWIKLDSGLEIPLAVEVELALELPATTAYGPIIPELRRYTAKIDYVYREGPTGFVVIRDHKGTGALSPAQEALHYLMSDQHLGYVYLWNLLRPELAGSKLMYDMIRLHAKITSPHTFHEEPRLVDPGAQLDDWYQRMLYLRAEMSAKWDQEPVAWISNTAPHGPCLSYGRACEYTGLCKRPSDVVGLLESRYHEKEKADVPT